MPKLITVSNKWAVGLSGDPLDLQDASEQFCSGIVLIRDGILPTSPDRFVLTADEFESLDKFEDVYTAAGRILNSINAILFVEEQARKPLTLSGVHEQALNGNWGVAIIVGSANIQMRGVKAYGQVGSFGLTASAPPQTLWIKLASTDDTVADVLSYLRGTPDWIDLYKAYEAMEKDIKASKRGAIAAWPPLSQIKAFTRDAQLYRHSKPWCDSKNIKSAGAMRLNEASSLIRAMIRIWIEWRL